MLRAGPFVNALYLVNQISRARQPIKISQVNAERQVMPLSIRPDFLPPQPPHNVTSTIIDFTSTAPAIPKYKDCFAAVIDNFMTEAECHELLALAEKSASDGSADSELWERAMVNIGNGKQALATDVRKCGRIIWDSTDIADRLLARLMPFFTEWDMVSLTAQGLAGKKRGYSLSRLNERLRFLKYVGGEYFRPHYDGNYRTPDRKEISFYTIHLYLNGEGEEEQDLKKILKMQQEEQENDSIRVEAGKEDGKRKLLGGATSFLPSWIKSDEAVRVWPKTGRVLVFQHDDLLHSGDSVYRGTKFTVRTDVMYSKSHVGIGTAQKATRTLEALV
jgi:2OG-Fe(II) oxygenase superfamily